MKNPSQLLADIVKVTRNDLGLSQSQVAERIDSDQRTVLNIENGRGNPKFKTLVSLFRVLKIDSRTVFNPELEPDNPVIHRLVSLTGTCTEQEATTLIPVVEAVLRALRSNNAADIE